MNKTFEDYVARYEKKTQGKFERNEDLNIYFLPDKGFCEIGVKENKIKVGAVCGDGKFWCNFANEIARRMDLKLGTVYFSRQMPKAYIRLLGFKIVEEKENSQGTKDFICVNDEGKNATVIPAYKDKNDNEIYRVLWEV